jgi:hypothetical protein
MKKQTLLAIAALMIFGLGAGTLAYQQTGSTARSATSCCCCKGDSCPMKQKDASGKETAVTHENCDCCAGCAESCPMMKKDADGKAMKMDGAHSCPMMKKDGEISATAATAVKTEGAESCPMMKGEASQKVVGMKHEMRADGKSHSCPCCSRQKEKKDAAAL